MRLLVRWTVATGVVLAGLSFAGIAGATAITMNFDQLTTGQSVAAYYNGGCSTSGNGNAPATCGGPASGVTWSGKSKVDAGSDGTSALQISAGSGTMSVVGGFTNLVFDYDYHGSGPFNITFYDSLGTAISTTLLGKCTGCHADITIASLALAVAFDPFPGNASLDNMTVQSIPSVPEPAALGTFGFGLLLIGAFVALRRRRGGAMRPAT